MWISSPPGQSNKGELRSPRHRGAEPRGTLRRAGKPGQALCSVLALLSGLASEAYAATITGTVKVTAAKDARGAVVYLDRIEGKEFPPPAEPAKMQQVGKEFVPHILTILKGGAVEFSNGDGILHNVHVYRGRRTLFNLATPAGGKPVTKTFQEPGEAAVLCDVHPEMSAYILVLETPYAAVTAQDGRYQLTDIPPGRHTLKAWHETSQPPSTPVVIQPGQVLEVNLQLK